MEDKDLFDMAALREELGVERRVKAESPEPQPAATAPVQEEAATQTPSADSAETTAPQQRTPYVRQRTPRRTQEAINDLAEDDNPIEYAHESNVAVGGMLGDRKYRRARSEITQFQKNNRYGQYLEIPKGRRSIFAKRERSRRRQGALAAVIVVAILAAVAYIVYYFMSNISFG